MQIPKQPYRNDYKLDEKKETDDDKQCRLRFASCDNKYPMEKLNSKEIKSFIIFAKKIENLTWKEIKFSDKSLNYEIIKNLKLPQNCNGITDATALRAGQKFRIIGYRNGEYFYIVWFDKNHKET